MLRFGDSGKAAPSTRLSYFLESFPNRNVFQTICDEDLSNALDQIAQLLARVTGTPCLEGDLSDSDPDAEYDETLHKAQALRRAAEESWRFI